MKELFLNILCCFVPSKKARHAIRNIGKAGGGGYETLPLGKVCIEKNGMAFCVNVEESSQEFWTLYKHNIWEVSTFKIFDTFLNKDFSYLDIGAWIGPTVLYGSKLARSVYAFEPDKLAFEKLQSNVSLNRDEQSNIYMYNFGISDKNEPIQFFIGKGATSMSSVIENEENNSASYYAEFYDIETAISRAQIAIKDINFIKVDIEGGEFDLIPSLVNFFIENTSLPTLFISTHIPFFVTQDMSEEVKKKIQEQKKRQLFDSLKAYPFLYNAGFKKITSYEQLSGDRFSEIIATTKQLD